MKDGARKFFPFLFLMLFGLSVLLSFLGCTTNSNPLADVPFEQDTVIDRYLLNYGPDFTVTRRVEGGTAVEEYSWPGRGIRIFAAMGTGQILRKETFTPNGRASW